MQAPALPTEYGSGGSSPAAIHGLTAEFATPGEILSATRKARKEGYTSLDAYTPFPVHGLVEAIGFKDPRLQWTIFFAGLTGAIGGFALQWWTSAVDYPMNVGGRPLLSWPSFIPVTFECTILLASFGAVFGMLALNGLPKPYHPIFNAANFARASQDRFFLCVEADDPQFDLEKTRAFLQSLGAINVSTVTDESGETW